MIKQLKPAFLMMVVLTVLTGVIYPAAITGIAQAAFRDKANGSLLVSNGQVIGSRLIGQPFSRPEYFHGRPSAAGSGYDATASAGSNLGPTSARLLNGTTKLDDRKQEAVDFDGLKLRLVHYCLDNDLALDTSAPLAQFKDAQGNLDDVKLIKAFNDDTLTVSARVPVPADAVTASASGLDPDISPRNAQIQAARVAKARGATVDRVMAIVARHTEGRTFGVLGEPRVHVLELNLDLDQQLVALKR